MKQIWHLLGSWVKGSRIRKRLPPQTRPLYAVWRYSMFEHLFRRLRPAPASVKGHYQHGNHQLIELRSVLKTYQSAAGSFTALKSVDLKVDRGEFVAIVGKSG